MEKTGTDIELYPHCTKEELILEYHLIAQKALEEIWTTRTKALI